MKNVGLIRLINIKEKNKKNCFNYHENNLYSIIPFSGFFAMNLFGILFVRNKYKNKPIPTTKINHESIHSEQYKDLLYIFFLPLYFLEWIIKIPFGWFYKKKNKNGSIITYVAYKSISFEQEAYYNQNNLDYLNTRKRFAWIKYIFSMYNPDNIY